MEWVLYVSLLNANSCVWLKCAGFMLGWGWIPLGMLVGLVKGGWFFKVNCSNHIIFRVIHGRVFYHKKTLYRSFQDYDEAGRYVCKGSIQPDTQSCCLSIMSRLLTVKKNLQLHLSKFGMLLYFGVNNDTHCTLPGCSVQKCVMLTFGSTIETRNGTMGDI